MRGKTAAARWFPVCDLQIEGIVTACCLLQAEKIHIILAQPDAWKQHRNGGNCEKNFNRGTDEADKA